MWGGGSARAAEGVQVWRVQAMLRLGRAGQAEGWAGRAEALQASRRHAQVPCAVFHPLRTAACHRIAQRSPPARRSFWVPGLMQVQSSMLRRGWKSIEEVYLRVRMVPIKIDVFTLLQPSGWKSMEEVYLRGCSVGMEKDVCLATEAKCKQPHHAQAGLEVHGCRCTCCTDKRWAPKTQRYQARHPRP